jgi:hypothetical protein
MIDSPAVVQSFSQEQLPRLHEITEQIEKECQSQLRTYLDVLAPLFRPRRVLGNFIEGPGTENVSGADRNFSDLREIFFKACGRPFDLRKELPSPIESVPGQLQLHQWEYSYDVTSDRDRKTIPVVSPLTWVLSYPSTYSFPMIRQLLPANQSHDTESSRTFVLRASLMYLMFAKLPGLTTLFEGLRYHVEFRKSAQLGELPIVTLSAPFATYRPSDEVLMRATGYAGRPGFVEVINPEEAANVVDPMRALIEKALQAAEQ